MPDQETHPLKFDCYKCGKKSIYTKYLQEGKDGEGAKEVLKKCTTCGADNNVIIPDGWIAARTETVLRGLKND